MSGLQNLSPEMQTLMSLACDDLLTDQQAAMLEEGCDSESHVRMLVDYLQLDAELSILLQGKKALDQSLEMLGAVPASSAPDHDFAVPAHTGLPVPVFLNTTPIDGTVGSFSSDWSLAYLIATVVFGIAGLVGSLVYVSRSEQFVENSPSPTAERQLAPLPKAEPETVGRITGMVDCKWDTEGLGIRDWGLDGGPGARGQGSGNRQSLIPNPQSRVSLGDRLSLRSGLLEITYNSGAKVILQGPVTYEVESSAGGYLSVGKLTARVETRGERREERGEGSNISKSPNLQMASPSPLSSLPSPLFAVRTPTATVTDLGTEFGVEVNKQGLTQVHVLQGIVETRGIGRPGSAELYERLTAGKAVEIGQKGAKIKTVAFAPQTFARTLQRPIDTPAEAAYINAVLADKPMAYWPLNEPAGARKFFDRSGNRIHGYAMGKPMAGCPGPLADKSRAIEFDGSSYIDLGRHDEFAMKNDFTMEAWLWIGDVKQSGYAFSALGGDANGGHIGWGFHASRPATGDGADAEGPIVLSFSVPPDPGDALYRGGDAELGRRWLHVAVVFDRANQARLYVNGELRGSIQKDHPAMAGDIWVQLGCAEKVADDYWHGRLAHVAVYPRALSQEQIQHHYSQRGAGGKEAPGKHHQD